MSGRPAGSLTTEKARLEPFDDGDDEAFGPESHLLEGMQPTGGRYYGGRKQSHHGARRRRKKDATAKYAGYGQGKREGTHSEWLLQQQRWYLRAIFWTIVATVITIGVAITVATILTAVWVRPQVMDVLARVKGMSDNVDTMTALGTDAPTQMSKAWQTANGDELLARGQRISQRIDRILARIEADPNLNDELYTTFNRIINKADHLMSKVTDEEWSRAKGYGLTVLQQGAAWSSNVSPELVRDTLQEGRDLSHEARTLLAEARQRNVLKTLNEAGHAASELGLRAARLDEVTIKLPPAHPMVASGHVATRPDAPARIDQQPRVDQEARASQEAPNKRASQ